MGGGYGGLIQNAISQLPYNMQHYVGGPSYSGMPTGQNAQQPQQQNAYMSGSYNQLTNDMRHGNMGAYGFGGGNFGYTPFQQSPFMPTWRGGYAQTGGGYPVSQSPPPGPTQPQPQQPQPQQPQQNYYQPRGVYGRGFRGGQMGMPQQSMYSEMPYPGYSGMPYGRWM